MKSRGTDGRREEVGGEGNQRHLYVDRGGGRTGDGERGIRSMTFKLNLEPNSI